LKSLGSSSDEAVIEKLVCQAQSFIKASTGAIEIDFTNQRQVYLDVLSSIQSHKLVGIDLVLGKIFEDIGFGKVKDPLFRDLVLYRLVYPKSKLRTTEYLKRYALKEYHEDELYRYMDKLHSRQKELVQQISIDHTIKIFNGEIHAVFYDVTTLHFEIDKEDELRITGFSKDGKHQHPQILLGLLVSRRAYPLAYDIFQGNKFEGETFMPILDGFARRFNIKNITVIADAGLLSKNNIEALKKRGYEFILGARIKNEKEELKKQILDYQFKNNIPLRIIKDELSLIVTYSEERAKKDQYNRKKGLNKLEKLLKNGKMTKSSINNKGYNKFLKLDGMLTVALDNDKVDADEKWDGLKGYLTNSSLNTDEILENYKHLWQIEKAFRIAKGELKIRPIFHYKQKRIEAHICLNFVAYKIYKELERQLQEKGTTLSPEKVIEIIQSI
jgi:transposase